MLLTIPDLLDSTQLDSVRRFLAQARFVDGRLSAGSAAAKVKQNLELDREQPGRDKLLEALMAALYARAEFRFAAYPARVATPLFARYVPGMAYGEHVDDPLMGGGPGQQYRSDIALTLFLNDPESYAGGELVVTTAFGEQQVKLPAGHLVLYPASSRHRVAPVTAGERLVMVTWLQSQVRDPARRELLYDLWRAREQLLAAAPDDPATRRVDTSYVNLLRMWAEP
ncbi:MAG TPA: Fe2+-dependent dioxygenase [Gammaproteobacteria bacterium]